MTCSSFVGHTICSSTNASMTQSHWCKLTGAAHAQHGMHMHGADLPGAAPMQQALQQAARERGPRLPGPEVPPLQPAARQGQTCCSTGEALSTGGCLRDSLCWCVHVLTRHPTVQVRAASLPRRGAAQAAGGRKSRTCTQHACPDALQCYMKQPGALLPVRPGAAQSKTQERGQGIPSRSRLGAPSCSCCQDAEQCLHGIVAPTLTGAAPLPVITQAFTLKGSITVL